MRKCISIIILSYFFNMAFSEHSMAQTAPQDSATQQHVFNNTANYFYSALGPQSPLYNGPEYYFYDPIIKGNAYFQDVNGFTSGSVLYDGIKYANVPMLYDLYSDKVAVLLYNHYSKFSLVKEKLKSFDFLDHHFININADTITIANNKAGLKSSYYDELYNGKLQVLVKRSKSIQTSPGGATGVETYFSPSRDFYLKKNNIYYSIGSQGELLDVLKDRKKELQQYIKSNQIKFRRDPEEVMVKVASYYDHLTN